MHPSTTSRPLLRAFYALLIAIAAFSALPRNARAQQLYVTQINQETFLGFVSEYNAATGALVKADFIAGLHIPTEIAVKENMLFVVNNGTGTVGKYDATTGGAINAGFITGLNAAVGIAVKEPLHLP